MPAHAHYRPGLRPWAWWKWNAPELRRVVGRDLAEDDEADCFDDRLPAAEDSNLPEWAKAKPTLESRLSMTAMFTRMNTGYLQRLDLLFAEEKAIFKKYGSMITVYDVQQGERGKCVRCWEWVREIAAMIDFDLDGSLQRYEFW